MGANARSAEEDSIERITMFEWLEEEIKSVGTPHFFEVEGPAPPDLRRAVESSDFPLPLSYKTFVLRFGNMKLYRYGSNYYVTVFAGPREATNSKGEEFVQFGRTWTSLAYFKESMLADGKECPVFEWYHDSLQKTADGFEEWLIKKCQAARNRFKRKEWEAILKGPAPFTEHEKVIVDARKHFRWRLMGVAANEDLQFEVHNGSNLILPYLSIGIRGKLRLPGHGPLIGGAWLPVSSILPGETHLIEKDCYKNLVDPHDVEAFDKPDPEPSLRDQYWEFKK
jgi:hypothetical protein